MRIHFSLFIMIALALSWSARAGNPFGFAQNSQPSTDSSGSVPQANEIVLLKGQFSESDHGLLAIVVPANLETAPMRIPVPVQFTDEVNQVQQILALFQTHSAQMIALNCQVYNEVAVNVGEINADNIDLGTCVESFN